MATKRAPKRSKKKTKTRVSAARRVSIDSLLSVLSVDEVAARAKVDTATVRRWKKEGAPLSRKNALASIIITDRERIDAKAQDIAARARKKGRVLKPGDAPGFNRSKKQETRRYRGAVENTRIRGKGILISAKSEETIVHSIMTKAKKLKRKQKKGRFFVTLGLVEFGQVQGSGGKKLVTVSKGRLGGFAAYSTFASTDPDYGQGGKRGALSLAGLESQVRNLVERLHGDPRGAAVLDSFTVKRYSRKSEKEVREWRTRGKT